MYVSESTEGTWRSFEPDVGAEVTYSEPARAATRSGATVSQFVVGGTRTHGSGQPDTWGSRSSRLQMRRWARVTI